jgi:PTH1 family peptidyl-tRNA hydrolase
MKLIVGLGNPGKDYANTRHNIGFRCINRFARINRISVKERQCRSQIGTGIIAGTEIVLAKPKTYMNNSGQAVGQLLRRFKLKPEELVIIHDDLDLPLGSIRIRQGGSSAGHKGIASIIQALGVQSFARIRIGVDHPAGEKEEDVISYVLSDFSPTDNAIAEKMIGLVADALHCILAEGIVQAMNKYNAAAQP